MRRAGLIATIAGGMLLAPIVPPPIVMAKPALVLAKPAIITARKQAVVHGTPVGFFRKAAVTPFFIGKTNGSAIASGSTHTTSHTVTASTTLLVAIVHCYNFNSTITISSVTWNSVALTNAVTIGGSTSSNESKVGIYYLFSPAAATANGVATFSTNVGQFGNCIWINVGGATSLGVTGSDRIFSGNVLSISTTPAQAHFTVYGVGIDNASGESGNFSAGITKESQVSGAGGGFPCVTTFGRRENAAGESLTTSYTKTVASPQGGEMATASFY